VNLHIFNYETNLVVR